VGLLGLLAGLWPVAVSGQDAALVGVVEAAKRIALDPNLQSPSKVTVQSAPAPERSVAPSGCCSLNHGFDITSTTVSLTANVVDDGYPCFDCVSDFTPGHLVIPFPLSVLYVGESASTHITFESFRPGPCNVAFLWYHPLIKKVIAANGAPIPDCGNGLIWTVQFFNIDVPKIPGNVIAIGVIGASDNTTDTNLMNFRIAVP
jgi:hypothetical protein